MAWYWIALICVAGAALLYVLLCVVLAKGVLKSATTPVAHTLDEARDFQREQENADFSDYDNAWNKRDFEVNGLSGTLRGEVIFNPAHNARNKVVIICHGHTWNRINSVKYAQIFYNLGYNVIIYDHAYFGLSDGKFTTLGDRERRDLSNVVDYARQTFGNDAIVGLHGESMGAVTVLCELGVRSDIDFVIADCAFSDTVKYYRQLCVKVTHLPGFPIVDIANAMSKRKFGYNFYAVAPIKDVRSSIAPVCFIHGASDKFIRPQHSKDMYAASGNPLSELHLFQHAGHARSYHADNIRYAQIISEFTSKVEGSLESTANIARK